MLLSFYVTSLNLIALLRDSSHYAAILFFFTFSKEGMKVMYLYMFLSWKVLIDQKMEMKILTYNMYMENRHVESSIYIFR